MIVCVQRKRLERGVEEGKRRGGLGDAAVLSLEQQKNASAKRHEIKCKNRNRKKLAARQPGRGFSSRQWGTVSAAGCGRQFKK